MKIAILAPSPVPFTIGGAENLMWGLCENINKLTEHQAELIKIPTKEHGFWELIESYYFFYTIDLSHFDMVITSKYPSWMVQHSNVVCYMMHTLRGLYDTYYLMGKSYEVDRLCEPVNEIVDYMEEHKRTVDLSHFFDMIFSLRDNCEIPDVYFEFPGPLIRKIIHYMDEYALTQRGMHKYCAISDTVKNRKDYFPANAEVKTIYPPTNLRECVCKKYEYVFMISRLDAPKRIDMLIKSMKYVKSNVRLLIAGMGPEKTRLEKMAQSDKRIEFLGFVRDEEVEEYYANALVVPYFPYDEDYGYITIEAMLHKKPVITTKDAGGPMEFVENGKSGFVVDFDARQIGEKIDFYAKNTNVAKEHGTNGYEKVKKITWDNALKELLKEESQLNKKNKIVVTSTFSVFPPRGGGQARTYNLYRTLVGKYDVDIVAFDDVSGRYAGREIAPNLIEFCIPMSKKHQMSEMRMTEKVKVPITDIAMITESSRTPQYGEILKKVGKEASLVILSHPYLYPEYKRNLSEIPFVYEAQDVEYDIKKGILPENQTARKMLERVFAVEKECCEKSVFIMTCSEKDRDRLSNLYGVDRDKIIVVPNGVDCQEIEFESVDERRRKKKELGIESEKVGLFMGSWHQPNLEACEAIFDIARQTPNVKYLLMGSQCNYFSGKKIPENVGLLGVLGEEEKHKVFDTVDFALNPMTSGSGTNLKMFDYMAAGIPVVSTKFGARGIDELNIMTICDINDMARIISEFSLDKQRECVNAARKYVEDKFDWSVIGKILEERLESEKVI